LDDLEDDFKITFDESEDIDTIGGWMQSNNTDITEGEYIDTEKDRWQVLEIESHSIKQVAYLKNYNVVSEDIEAEDDEDSSEAN
ncbi:MAG TPA: transporter associated domain protein, partial [Jeotgalicoccus aerolatus]|nr:transporter associated domain protein [Jeotgalicoccus aerolatus]